LVAKTVVLKNYSASQNSCSTLLNGIKFCSSRASVVTKKKYLTPKLVVRITSNFQEMMRIGMNVICGNFPCTNTTKKSYSYTRNNCQDL